MKIIAKKKGHTIIIIFNLYFSILLSISILFHKKGQCSITNKATFSSEKLDLNIWLTAISAQAADMSYWFFLAFPGVIFVHGLSDIWIGIGLIFFMFLSWTFIAYQIGVEADKYNALTLSLYFQKKFNDKNEIIKNISSCIYLYFYIFYIAAGLIAMSKILQFSFEINYFIALLAGSTLLTLFIFAECVCAYIWSSLFQGLFLLFTIIFIPIIGLSKIGGIENLNNGLKLFSDHFSSFIPENSILSLIVIILSWGIGYFGQPHILVSFFGIDSRRDVQKSTFIGISWQIIAMLSSTAIGIIGKILLFGKSTPNPELIFIYMINLLSSPIINSLIIAILISSIIATISSQILITSSLLTKDLRIIDKPKKLSSIWKNLYYKTTLISIPMLSFIVSLNRNASLYNLIAYAWSGLGSTLGPIVLLSLYTKILNRYGIIAGMITGGLTSGILPIITTTSLPPLIFGFMTNVTAAIIVSLTTKFLIEKNH